MMLKLPNSLMETAVHGVDGAFIEQEYMLTVTRKEESASLRVVVRLNYDGFGFKDKTISYFPEWNKKDEYSGNVDLKFCILALKQYEHEVNEMMGIDDTKIISFLAGVPHNDMTYDSRWVQGVLKLVNQWVMYR